MSAILESPATMPTRTARRVWLREPLLHFLLIGGLLFATDHLRSGRDDDPRTIVVGAAVDHEATTLFRTTRGRAPNPDELQALRQAWIDNELLYREGLALQLDKGDSTIRDRVIFKALSAIEADLKRPVADEPRVRAWFEARRAKYDEPARYDFQEAVLVGDNSETAVRAFVAALQAGNPGEARAGLRVFKGRPHDNLVHSYGAEFARALEASAPGEWRALQGRDGWRAVRLEGVSAARPADYAALRGVLAQDWLDATMAEQRTAAVRALAAKYRVRVEGAR